MTVERAECPEGTPLGGVYTIACWIDFATGAEVEKDMATGVMISEYDADDNWLGETVASLTPRVKDE
jgi:hypothetical protein